VYLEALKGVKQNTEGHSCTKVELPSILLLFELRLRDLAACLCRWKAKSCRDVHAAVLLLNDGEAGSNCQRSCEYILYCSFFCPQVLWRVRLIIPPPSLERLELLDLFPHFPHGRELALHIYSEP
jgi:hypothetical protein